MANSGTKYTGTISYDGYNTQLKIAFHWNVTDIDADAGTAKLNYKVYGESPNTVQHKSFGTGDRNYLKIDGEFVYKLSTNGNGTKSNPFIMFCDDSVHDTTTRWVTTDSYSFNGYIQRWGVLAEGSKTIYYDDDYASFTVFGAFQWYVGAGLDYRVYISDGNGNAATIQLDKIERHSKVRSSGNKGKNWSRNKFVYVTSDYGNTWRKCNAYKTTNSGRNWTKIT